MKATGIIRRIDDLGRIAIPKEIRRRLHIREGDPLEFFFDSESIVLKKYLPVGEWVDHVAQTARKLSLVFAVYVGDALIEANRLGVFDNALPDEWLECRKATSGLNNGHGDFVMVFPIMVDGKQNGCFVVLDDLSSAEARRQIFNQGTAIAAMAEAELEE